MRKRRRLLGVLLIIAALIIMTLPVSEADAAAPASDFVIQGGTLVKYRGTETNVSVPDTVEIIGESAFEDNTKVELVVLPNSVKRIDAYAFWGCDNLDTVVLGRGLTAVGDYAFTGCKGLRQMSIPSNVTSIGIQAFGDCVNMTDITIPAETFDIHETAFDGCARLVIHCDEGTAAAKFAEEFYERQKEMPEYEDVPDYRPDTPVIPPVQEPTDTPNPTPDYEDVGELLGSSSVVGNKAVIFLDVAQLNVVEGEQDSAPEEEFSTYLAGMAETLANMVSMGTMERLPKYTIVDGKIVADQAYYRNNTLGAMRLPEGIVEIGQFSFARSTLTEVYLPEGVMDICYGAFYHCDNLSKVLLPETVMNVEPKAFAHTAWIENFKRSGEPFLISGDVLIAYNGDSTSVDIPGGVRVIAAEAFAGHAEIQSVRLPDSILVIGEDAFLGCTGLRQVKLGDGVSEIKDRAFGDCDSLEVIKLPASVKTVGLRAFGDAEIIYNGAMPETSYEVTATRLSNEKYRDVENNDTTRGVTVTGAEPAAARLEGATRPYRLTVNQVADSEQIETAWRRVFENPMPQNMNLYDLQLTDESGIPLTKLGYSGLVVILPMPENLQGQKVQLVTLDRNGQLETLNAERIMLDGTEAFRFRTTHLSLFGVYGTGAADTREELKEVSVSLYSMSEGPGSTGVDRRLLKLVLGVSLLIAGSILFLNGISVKKAKKH